MDHTFLSSLAGYLSILCWLIVFTPQLWENYKRKSGDGLSMTFLVIWLAGDVFNLLGVIMQDLLVTMFVLALYYTVADMGLIWQVIYYQRRKEEQEEDLLIPAATEQVEAEAADEHTLLIGGSSTSGTNSSAVSYRSTTNNDASTITSTSTKRKTTTILFNLLSAISIVLVTVISCYFYYHVHWLSKGNNNSQEEEGEGLKWLPQLMGWMSAILYVGSRIPQILKNLRNKSTEGLSFGMFLCAVMGNVLFTSSIFLKSTEKNYILVNLSWIVGSCGTLIFDFIIFIQFFVYENKQHHGTGKIIV